MTQEATSAGDTGGAAGQAEDVSRAVPAPASEKLPDNAAALLSPEILATAPKTDTEDDGEDAAPDATPAPAAADSAEGQDDGETDGEPQDEVATWATAIDEAPQRITEVPRALQAKVLAKYKADLEAAAVGAVQTADQRAYQRGLAEGRQGVEQGSKLSQAQELLDSGDVDAFKEYVNREFGSEQNYHRAAAGLPPAPSAAVAAIQTRAKALFDRVKPPPEVEAVLKANWNYPATDAGYDQLAADLTDAMVKHARGTAAADPARQALEQRRNGAEHRARVPRPETSEGRARGNGGLPTLAEFTTWSTEEAAKLTPEQIDQVLATA